jgi:23S rRNA (cytosine1962-C5)-methyltransferase
VHASALEPLRRGHPWVWRNWVTDSPATLARLTHGDEVHVTGPDRAVLAMGIYDATSPIAIRIWSVGDTPSMTDLITRRLAAAFELRRALFTDESTNAYRILNGEGDYTPGIVLDRYDTVAVLRLDTESCAPWVERARHVFHDELRSLGVRTLVIKPKRRSSTRLEVVFGSLSSTVVRVREHGVEWFADLEKGQKTGAFLDQRENRMRVRALCAGKTVLNLFSYTGGFSLSAVVGGAQSVTSVDISAEAHRLAQRSFEHAGHAAREHEFVTRDVFDFLRAAAREGRSWDVIISDPPSFAPSEKALPKAVTAYRKLHHACVQVLGATHAHGANGILCAASCSSHLPASTFVRTLDSLALGARPLRLTELWGQPADHPTTPAWVEGRYLKFAVLR